MAPITIDTITDLDAWLEAEDGVVEVPRVLEHLAFPWMALRAGPRRWAPTDLFADVQDGGIEHVRMTYRTVGDRVVVVAGSKASVQIDWLAQKVATPLLYAHLRKTGGTVPPGALLGALQDDVEWEDNQATGWRWGQVGIGSRPVRVSHLPGESGHVLLASHGVAAEEHTTLVASLDPLEPGGQVAADLQQRHRRALAQRWWDAPRAPWRPED